MFTLTSTFEFLTFKETCVFPAATERPFVSMETAVRDDVTRRTRRNDKTGGGGNLEFTLI